jgi:hypothetical protein
MDNILKIKRLQFTALLFIVLLLAAACQDFVAEELGANKVTLLSPADSIQSTLLMPTFWWNAVNGAESYRLQIVSPSFARPEKMILDSAVSGTKCTIQLLPGKYEWRVKAVNNISETPYTVHYFVIAETADLSAQIVQLTSPVTNDTVNKTQQIYLWQKMNKADNYNFQVWKGSTKIADFLTDNITYTYAIAEGDGAYQWKVRAQNTASNTTYSLRNLFIDTQAPPIPTLSSPATNTTLKDSVVTFQWQRATDNGSRIWDSVFIYKYTSGTQQLYISKASSTFHLINTLPSGTWYWMVRSYDRAGNISPTASELRLFTIN